MRLSMICANHTNNKKIRPGFVSSASGNSQRGFKTPGEVTNCVPKSQRVSEKASSVSSTFVVIVIIVLDDSHSSTYSHLPPNGDLPPVGELELALSRPGTDTYASCQPLCHGSGLAEMRAASAYRYLHASPEKTEKDLCAAETP